VDLGRNLIQRVNVGDSLTRSAAAHPEHVAVVDGERRFTYAEFNRWVIKTGGENVASIEVEKAVYAADPRVSEVVVVGLPHERWTEAITAVVVTKEGATIDADALLAELKHRLAGFKVPKSVIVVDELPKTSTGKIQKNRVRADHATHYES
jgi:non-ribosomal peptide synthetase component E (peptide arylation enzyme)